MLHAIPKNLIAGTPTINERLTEQFYSVANYAMDGWVADIRDPASEIDLSRTDRFVQVRRERSRTVGGLVVQPSVVFLSAAGQRTYGRHSPKGLQSLNREHINSNIARFYGELLQ